MNLPSVLLVDDDADVRVMVRALLEDAGYVVCCAASGPEALSLLHHVRPKLMLVDLAMPLMTGAELLRELARDDSVQPLAVVAISGCVDHRASPARWFLSKPLNTALLLSVVADLCGPAPAAAPEHDGARRRGPMGDSDQAAAVVASRIAATARMALARR